ncbi:MAG: N-acetylmuramoyl-L-alanine amidase [Acidobacteria bacterium]|nr:N-acetylmuramoyl-L-alanine amidase [Acidobacteriota bacterium]
MRSQPLPMIISRADWKAQKAIGEGRPHSIRYITIHHTGELQKPGRTIEAKMQSLQNFSQSVSKLASGKTKPAWFDVPYHFYIATDGKIAEGRELGFAEIQTPTMIRPATPLLALRGILRLNSRLPNN